MSDMKWPVAALEIRLQDPDPMIRAWAARWLRDYHGAAGETALRRFAEARQSVPAVTAEGADLGPTKAEPGAQAVGQELLLGGERSDLRAFLDQALADPQITLTPDVLAACPPISLLPRVLASIRRGVEESEDWDGLAKLVLLVGGAGVEYISLAEVALGQRPLDAYLADLGRHVAKIPETLPQLLRTYLVEKKRSVQDLLLALAPLWPAGGEEEIPWESSSALARVRGQLAWRIASCRAFAEDVSKWSLSEDAVDRATVLLTALSAASLRTRAILDRVRDDASPEERLSLAGEDYAWFDASVFAWTVEAWASRRGELASRALERLQATKDPLGRSNLLRLIGEARDEGILGQLLDHLAKKGVDMVESAAHEALAPFASRAREALRGRLSTAHPTLQLVAMQLVIDDPSEEAERFLYDEWDAIAARIPVISPLCTAAEIFASPRFLEKLLPLWRPGEVRIENAIAFLSKWTKEAAPPVRRIAEIQRARWEREERRKPPRLGSVESLEEVVHRFYRVPLGCSRCGAVYRYDVGYCYMKPVQGPTAQELRLEFRGFQRVVQCKRCLARDEYDLTEKGQFILHCRQQLAIALVEQGKPWPEVFSRSLCVLDAPRTSDGTEFASITDAIRWQLGRVRRAPRDADAWTHLGNLYHRGGLFADAREAFETAIGIDPSRADAIFGLGVLDHEEARPERAAERFRGVVRILAQRKVPPQVGYPCFDESLRRLLDIERHDGVPFRWELGGDPGDLASAAVRQRLYFKLVGMEPPTRRSEVPRDVGRNDPCPCGSGKKYKKCCGKE